LKRVKLRPAKNSDAKMRGISFSSDAIHRPISNMPEDVKDQVINVMKAFPTPLFSF